MDRYQETIDTWDAVAEAYAEKFMELDWYDASYDRFCELLPAPNPKVLELGCGPGNVSRYLLQKCPDMRLLATDVAPAMLEVARRKLPEAQFQLLDARQLSELQDTYQGILAGFVAPYLSGQDIGQLLTDAHQLLSPEGILYLSYIPGSPDKSGYIQGSTGQRMYVYYHLTPDLVSLVQQSGFALVAQLEIPYPERDETHVVLICQRS